MELTTKYRIALSSLIEQGITVVWNDPEPIEGSENKITKVFEYSDDIVSVQMGMSEAEILPSEILIDGEQAMQRLHQLVEEEKELDLTELQNYEYLYLYWYFVNNNINIPFGIEI